MTLGERNEIVDRIPQKASCLNLSIPQTAEEIAIAHRLACADRRAGKAADECIGKAVRRSARQVHKNKVADLSISKRGGV